VTLGRKDSVHARRQAAESITDNTLVQKLFNDIAPRMADRNGGYTRIIKLGPRRGDGAEMAILEFVDYGGGATVTEEKPAKGAKKAASKKAAPKKAAPAKEVSKKAASKKGADEASEKKPAKKKKKEEE
jgi:large subunit ribosomal protein L17